MRKIRLKVFFPLLLCAAGEFGLCAQSPVAGFVGEWHGTSVLGVTPLLFYYEDGTFETGLVDVFGKRYPVCKGNYTVSGNVITETVSYVEKSFYGRISRIKAGETVMRVTAQENGTLLSEDAPFGGRVIFTKFAPE
jgi:hypothetical protein